MSALDELMANWCTLIRLEPWGLQPEDRVWCASVPSWSGLNVTELHVDLLERLRWVPRPMCRKLGLSLWREGTMLCLKLHLYDRRQGPQLHVF